MSYLFKYYSKQYDGFMRHFRLDNNDSIIESLGDIRGLKILDIGGGTGTLASKLIELGADVTILDPEIKMTNIAKAKNSKVKINNGYSHNTAIDNEDVDLVVIRDTFHHIRQKELTLKESNRILKKGGRIVIYEFDRKNYITKLIAIFERCCFERVMMLSSDEMDKMADEYFEKQSIKKVSSYEFIYVGIKE